MKHPAGGHRTFATENSMMESAFVQELSQVTMDFNNVHLESGGSPEKTPRINDSTDAHCTYCCLTFEDLSELRAHCQTESHQTVIMSDEGRDWKHRPPPRGLTSDAYLLCENWTIGGGTCRYEAQCVDAHGSEELAEWQERFEYRKMKLQRAFERELFGKSYAEELLDRWIQAASPEKVMREKLHDVEESCSGELTTMVTSKISNQEWKFSLRTHRLLRTVALLQDAHRNHFFLRRISTNDMLGKILFVSEPSSVQDTQEWNAATSPVVGTIPSEMCGSIVMEHLVEVAFTTDIYGTFRQSVVFDFGGEPVLVRHLCVDVVPVTDVDRIKEVHKEHVLSGSERWDNTNTHIIKFTSNIDHAPPFSNYWNDEREKDLLFAYPTPQADTFTLTQSTVLEKKLTCNNYRARMHELLYVEEMAQYDQVARYNVTARLQLANCYLLAPNGPSNSTAKYANSGELFALMNLDKDVSEDTPAGRLILNNCTTVLLAPMKLQSAECEMNVVLDIHGNKTHLVYEALIEDKGKNIIYLRLASKCVDTLRLKPDTDLVAEVQFQLNRLPYCEWHYAVDKMADFRILFPYTFVEPNIPWTPQRQWSDILDPRLNLKQKEAVVAITSPASCRLPPILIIGPFGTGKTYTLAQAIKQLLLQPDTRVLVCTHSNSAADLYIKDYLHPYVEEGHGHARPLRIYYHRRWVATVHSVVQKYCLIDIAGGVKMFRTPTIDDIRQHRVIVATLSISTYLSTLGLEKGFFSHILLDEAAQAMECEAIMPLALADDTTRIVLAGDHMQLSPELFSPFAKERNLHVSLLERLYDHYPATYPCKILLCENYRAHEAIIQFTSELFYEQKLISSGKQPRHDNFYPLTFFTARGEDIQDVNSTAFYNNSEVYEIVERVLELRKKWPLSWGDIDDQSIGIMTPYSSQVFRIRSELRKRRMGGISVERVLNVQGKQFRAIFLSTVRTRRTCLPGSNSSVGVEDMDYGFLSNSKLLNTAITRAQSLVAVIGDPVALCSVGRCRKVWERFIDICNENKSLFGMTWSSLKSQLDGVELKKAYVLNPLAPEFIPRQYQAEAFSHVPSSFTVCHGVAPFAASSVGGPSVRFPHASEAILTPANYIPTPANYMSSASQPPPALHMQPSLPANTGPPLFYFPGCPAPPIAHPLPLSTPNSNFYPWKTLGPVGVFTPPVIYTTVAPPAIPPVESWGNPMNSPVMQGNASWGQNMQGEHWKKTAHSSSQIPPAFPMIPHEELQPQKCIAALPPRTSRPAKVEGRAGPVSSVSSSVDDCYIPGRAISPTPLSRCSPSSDTVCTTTGSIEKTEQIQFLQNVHFPEKLTEEREKRQKETNTILPPEISLGQLFSSQSQQEWYHHLLETSDLETANKFMEMILAGNAHEVKNPSPMSLNQECFDPHVVQGLEELFNERSLSGPGPIGDYRTDTYVQRSHIFSQLRISQHNKRQVLYSDGSPLENIPLPEGETHISEREKARIEFSSFSMIGGKTHILQDTELPKFEKEHCVAEVEEVAVEQHSCQRTNSAYFSHTREIHFHPHEDMHFKRNWPPRTVQNNISIYPSRGNDGVASLSELFVPPVHNLLEGVVDKTSTGGSGAFAGYARAAVNIGFQHHNETTVPAASHCQQYHSNHQITSHCSRNVLEEEQINFHPSVECNTEFELTKCADVINHANRSEKGYASVSRSTKIDEIHSSGKQEDRNSVENPYSVLHVLGSKTAPGSPPLYHYFS